MIRCLIIDDEPLAQNVIELYIKRVNFLQMVGRCDNAVDALAIVEREEVDLIFCDIQMPEITGVEFVKSLRTKPYVIFTTAFAEYALEGFNVDAVDFLLKPVAFERFLRSVNKVKNLIKVESPAKPEGAPDHIFVKEDYKLVKINHNDIFYVQGMKDYVKIFTTAKTIITHITMKRLEELLPTDGFYRSHKSFIVRLGAIKTVYGNVIEMTNGTQVPIGLQYRDQLMIQLKSIN